MPCAGLRNGAFYVTPRPFFFLHVMGIRAYMLGRSIVMKAVGMWHWEVQNSLTQLHYFWRLRPRQEGQSAPSFRECVFGEHNRALLPGLKFLNHCWRSC